VSGPAETPYTPDYYRAIQAGARRSAAAIVPLVMDLAAPRSVVDVGCGAGTWLAAFAEHSVDDLLGVDSDSVDPALLEIPTEAFHVADLSRPLKLERSFDLVVSLEVAEHLPPAAADGFVESLSRLGSLILFSAAIPHQGGAGHINEQWPAYWSRRFADHGFEAVDCLRGPVWDDQRVEWWYAQNTLVFATPDELERRPALARHRVAGPPLPLVHPAKYLLLVEWATSLADRQRAAP